MEIAFFWFVGSIVVGIIAGAKGRSGFIYFVLSLLLSPLLIGILAIALPAAAGEQRATPNTHVRCPDCRELVYADAVRCRHCGVKLIPQSTVRP